MSQLDLDEMDRLRAENARLQALVDEMQDYKDASDQWQRMYQQEADENYDLIKKCGGAGCVGVTPSPTRSSLSRERRL